MHLMSVVAVRNVPRLSYNPVEGHQMLPGGVLKVYSVSKLACPVKQSETEDNLVSFLSTTSMKLIILVQLKIQTLDSPGVLPV